MNLSIVTINYNNVFGLQQTIDSVLSQNIHSFEYLLIDGGSIDGSLDVIHSNANYIDYWVSEKDKGIYDAMNKGIAKATGEYLMFLNSGDLLVGADCLKKCLLYLEENSGVDILYGDLVVKNHSNPKYLIHTHPKVLTLPFFENDTINHQASLIKADLFQIFGLYKLEYKLAADYYFFLQCFLSDKVFIHADFNMINYDFSGQSSVDGFKNYKAEQQIIWKSIVPKYVIELIQERRTFLFCIDKLKHTSSYKIVSFAIKINSIMQRIRTYLVNK